jgi:CRISPR-associated protein Csm3
MQKTKRNITIEVLTGLHIGIGSDRPEIGGVDNPFIKDPISKLPYIPGSSLKGKIKSLLETESEYPKSEIKTNFEGNDFGPTRLIFRDINLTDDWRQKYKSGEVQTEIKTEIKIDRQRGTAAPGALRSTERIPPTTVFEGEILIRYTDEEELERIEKMLQDGIKLLNNDYLGGSGSRGYGAVKVTLEKTE